MKLLMTLIATLTLVASLAAQDVTVVAVPSEMSEATGKAIEDTVMALVVSEKTGDRIVVMNARTQQTIVSMTIPKGVARARVRKLLKELGELKALLKRTATIRVTDDSEQIRVPQTLSTIGANIQRGAGKTRVVLFGLPAYRDVRDATFTFGAGIVPNDAYITAPSSKSVFGTSDRLGTLKNVDVHFCYVRDRFANELERRAVARFWALFVRQMGATLSTFEASPDVVLDRLQAGVSDPIMPSEKLDRSKTNLVMVRYVSEAPKPKAKEKPKPVKKVQPAAQPTAEAQSPLSSSPKVRQAVDAAVKKIEAPQRGNVVIGAFWYVAAKETAAVDVDVYFRKNPKAEELYFGNKETEGGWHRGDVMRSHSVGDDADWKVAGEVIEVEDTDLGEASLWLNLYKGTGERVEGIVRIINPKGQVVDVPFVFNGKGDRTKGKLSREKSASWFRIDLTKEVSHVASK